MRSVLAKAVRRDMRRAMGEHAVQQVETQTDALGAHETRIAVLQDQQAFLAQKHGWHENRLTLLEARESIHIKQRDHLGRTLWTRLRWLLTGQ